MLKYLIALIDGSAPSFCHYPKPVDSVQMNEQTLRDCIRFAMKENLIVQFLLPAEGVPNRYFDLMDRVSHIKIAPAEHSLNAAVDVLVADDTKHLTSETLGFTGALVLRVSKTDLLNNSDTLLPLLHRKGRTNIVISDIAEMDDREFDAYKDTLDRMVDYVVQNKIDPLGLDLNILSDRIKLTSMNNCGAGVETVTVAPDGKLYECPGFYVSGAAATGDIKRGINQVNPQLYGLKHAPICRACDTWHCKRCVWLNQQTTLEVNTPSRQQCVAAHLERNAARRLQQLTGIHPDNLIPEIDYLDPFEVVKHKY